MPSRRRAPFAAGVAAVVLAALAAVFDAARGDTGATPESSSLSAQNIRLHFPDAGTDRIFDFGADPGADAVRLGAPEIRPDARSAALAPLGQVGYGRTSIEALNRTQSAASIDVRAFAKHDGVEAATAHHDLPAGDSRAFDLMSLTAADAAGRYGVEIESSGTLAALARTRWASGAGVAYEAPLAAREIIVPLFVVNQAGQSSFLFAHGGDPDVTIDLAIHQPDSGAIGVSTQSTVGAHQVMEWDSANDSTLFGPQNLAPNAAGGFIGTARVSANRPVAVLSYVDVGGPATAALVGRGVADAARVQVLPSVRAHVDGGSLIAVANASGSRANVSATFVSMAGATVATARFLIDPRGAAYLDLSGAGRSPQAIAPLPPAGFAGSAIIESTQPVLAASLEDWRAGATVERLAAYNALGPRDLSRSWVVPVVKRATDFVSTRIVVHNPNPGTAVAHIVALAGGDEPAVDATRSLAPGASLQLDLGGETAFPIGTGRASVTADLPLAVVVYERRDDSRAYPIPPLTMVIDKEFNSEVMARAVLNQEGDDVRIVITQTEGDRNSFSAFVQAATCSLEDADAKHTLADVTGGRSTSLVKNIDLRSISDGQHAIRLKRGRWRQACGIIPELHGVEAADHSIVRALAAEPGPDALPTAGLPPTATAESTAAAPTSVTTAAATEAATAAAPTAASTSPATPATPADASRVWLPIARRGE
ncbi:MAG: hypothetical protein IT332_09420 [Ardenticatenales bacterium]|nr:hypothetical protein [Ardenticatenales bacterium]